MYGLNKRKVRQLAFQYAKAKAKKIPQTWELKQIAGEDWLRGFRYRCGRLSLRKAESTSLARTMAFNPHNVKLIFDSLKTLHDRLKISPAMIWNLDETGVNTVPIFSQILCETGTKQV